MNIILFSLIAASFAAFTNYIFRKSAENTSCYLLFYYVFALIAAFTLHSELLTLPFSPIPFVVGGAVGTLNVLLMQILSKALKNGPSGLTFAFQNASAVFPGMILFLFFQQELNLTFSSFQLVGMGLVLAGLFLATRGSSSNNFSLFKWLQFAIGAFVIQILALMLIQARGLFFEEHLDIWFMPGQFFFSLLVQTFIFFSQKSTIEKKTICYGMMGGLSNFASTGILLLATKIALPYEKVILFPAFSVGTIILSNLWANRLYQERFHFTANSTCALGILCSVY